MCLPLEKWCDGLQDCPDDELNCTTVPPVLVTEAPVVTTQAVTVAATAAPTTTAKRESPDFRLHQFINLIIHTLGIV